jgi:NhaP-type Na+/H+ or K+/H+ antiporter
LLVHAAHPFVPPIIATSSQTFQSTVLALGALLVLGALVSGLARRSFVSLAALFVIAGFLLGHGVAGALTFDASSGFVAELATVALIVILFRDGLEVDGEMLQSHWHLPFRKLVLAMPLTAVIVALAARLLVGLGWTECFLLGALLSPTDPVLSSSVVTNPRVLLPHGNGLISVYVTAIALGIQRPDLRSYFASQAATLVEVVKLGVFVVFGALLTVHGLFGSGWAAVGVVVVTLLVARPVAVFAALLGTSTDVPTRGFMAWFGPKGVATMTFSLLVLSDQITAGTKIFNLAALVVFCSILAHGATDTAGAEWIARRSEAGG